MTNCTPKIVPFFRKRTGKAMCALQLQNGFHLCCIVLAQAALMGPACAKDECKIPHTPHRSMATESLTTLNQPTPDNRIEVGSSAQAFSYFPAI
jgi:hypothetical protein